MNGATPMNLVGIPARAVAVTLTSHVGCPTTPAK
jgi:hypothetical protein